MIIMIFYLRLGILPNFFISDIFLPFPLYKIELKNERFMK